MGFRMPPPLEPGSLVAVVAPASPFDRDELFRGLAWLRTRYRLRISTDIFSRSGYLAGDDGRRLRELTSAMTDHEVAAIIAARGGYGTMRILDRLPWDDFANAPKWLVGFSDVTALHLQASDRGVCTLHAPNVTGLGRSITAGERASLLHALEDPSAAPIWTELTMVHDGEAEGLVIGGNLALVEAMAAADRLHVPEGAILVLEDVTERPYRIDRMLTALRLGGHLARASAIVFGGFTQCEPGADAVTVEDVVTHLAESLRIPVALGAPFGHGAPNHTFVLGRRARLAKRALTFG
jgi:muramoyltetrapeptide carboxypeptidase